MALVQKSCIAWIRLCSKVMLHPSLIGCFGNFHSGILLWAIWEPSLNLTLHRHHIWLISHLKETVKSILSFPYRQVILMGTIYFCVNYFPFYRSIQFNLFFYALFQKLLTVILGGNICSWVTILQICLLSLFILSISNTHGHLFDFFILWSF